MEQHLFIFCSNISSIYLGQAWKQIVLMHRKHHTRQRQRMLGYGGFILGIYCGTLTEATKSVNAEFMCAAVQFGMLAGPWEPPPD